MPWQLYIVAVLGTWILWKTFALYRNYRIAKTIGLPIRICPFNAIDPDWVLIYRSTPIISLVRKLPFGLSEWVRYSYVGWMFDDKYAIHREVGPAFVLVTPSRNEVILADPDAIHAVHARRKEYIKPAIMYDPLNIFGPNLDTVEGDDWQRHRKLTAPNFNEKISSMVWDEALIQARPMLGQWLATEEHGTRETVADTAKLTLHVLTRAAFGMSYSYDKADDLPHGHQMSYRAALSIVMRDWFFLLILPKKVFAMPFISKRLSQLGKATQEFQTYMEEMLENEKRSTSKREPGAFNLMSALVRASENASQAETESMVRQGLNDKEIFGNIFIYNIAGHETTANTVAVALTLLAAHPQLQDWLSEGIRQATRDSSRQQPWAYEATFPSLKRCLAVMFETLRLYGSVPFIPKSTGFHQQQLMINNEPHTLPAGTFVVTNSQGLHTDPASWGPDSLSWRPDRWIKQSSSGVEELIEPPAFIAWADGPRACPGRKFSQVEFSAVLATLFCENRVEPVLATGERVEDGRKKLMAMVEDSGVNSITLQMRNPKTVALRWRKASGPKGAN